MATNYLTRNNVQKITITLEVGQTSKSATVNSVGSGAFLVWGGIASSGSTDGSQAFCSLTLTNSTTVTATRINGSTDSVIVEAYLVDGDTTNLIQSVQYGTATIADTASSGTATISAVTNNYAAPHLIGWTTTNTSFSGLNDLPRISLSGTTLTATRLGTTGTLVVSFIIIEFKSTALARAVQNVSAKSSSSVTSFTATISSVTLNNTMSFFCGHTIATATTNLAQIKMRGYTSASTTFTASVNTGAAYAKTYNASVVSFASGLLAGNVQRNTTSFTANYGGQTAATVVTSSNVNGAVANYCGNSTNATTADLSSGLSEVQFGVGDWYWGSADALTGGEFTTAHTPMDLSFSGTALVGGELLVACIIVDNGDAAAVSITDNLSQTWTHDATLDASDSNNGSKLQIWYKQNTAAGVTSITISGNTNYSVWADIYAFTGVPTSGTPWRNYVSISDQASVAANTDLTLPAITTTNPQDIIVMNNDGIGIESPTQVHNVSGYYTPPGKLVNYAAPCHSGSSGVAGWGATVVAFKGTTTSVNIQALRGKDNSPSTTTAWEAVVFPVYNGSATFDATVTTFSLTGVATGFQFIHVLTAPVKTYSLAGISAVLKRALNAAVSVGAFTFSGIAATFNRGKAMIVTVGTFAIAGIAATFRRIRFVTAVVGAFAETGIAAVLKRGLKAVASVGSFALSGISVAMKRTYRATVAAASFALVGTAIILLRIRIFTVASASFVLTRVASSLLRGRVVVTSVASFRLWGIASILRRTRFLTVQAGAFALTRIAAILRRAISLYPMVVSFALTGRAVSYRRIYRMAASVSTYALSRLTTKLLWGRRMATAARSFALSGVAASFRRTYRATARAVAFKLHGVDALLWRARHLVFACAAGAYVLAEQAASFLRGFLHEFGTVHVQDRSFGVEANDALASSVIVSDIKAGSVDISEVKK